MIFCIYLTKKVWLIALLCTLLFSSFLQAQTSASRQSSNQSYAGFYMSVGVNAWQIRESQFNLLFNVSPNDFINSMTSISARTIAPHIALGAEFGGISSYFLGFNTQFSFGGMTGTYLDIAGGINYPIVANKVTLQVGAGVFYQIANKLLDSRRLRQGVRLDGRNFNTINSFNTSLISENLGFRPFVTLKIATRKSSQLRIQAGYQFNFYENARIRFKQVRNTGRNSYSTVARFYLDDNLFDFKYNDQYINRLPFDYGGFFVNIGIMWSIGGL